MAEAKAWRRDGIASLAFDLQGTRLAAGCLEGMVRVLSVDGQGIGAKGVARFEGAIAGHAEQLVFSPAGDLLAVADEEGAISLWAPRLNRFVGGPLRGHPEGLATLTFEPDGKHLVSSGRDGTAIRWDVDAASWQARACAIANRNLTREEWLRHLTAFNNAIPYERVCKNPGALPHGLAGGRAGAT